MSLIKLGASTTKEFIKNLNDNFENLPNELYPVGSIWIGGATGEFSNKTPIRPSRIFGGEWEIVDKEFENKIITYNQDTIKDAAGENGKYIDSFNGVGSFNRTLSIQYEGHSITFTTEINILEGLSIEEGHEIFSLYNEEDNKWGIDFRAEANENITLKQYNFAWDDSGNKIYMIDSKIENEVRSDVNYKRIYFSGVDTVPQEATGKNDLVGVTIKMDFLPKCIKNEYCDKFYWKRIS